MTRAITPEIEDLAAALDAASTQRNGQVAVDRAALETYIAGRFGPTITDPRVWADPMKATWLGRHRRLAERIVSDHPRVSAEEMAGARAALRPFFRRQARLRQAVKNIPLTMIAINLAGVCMMCIAFLGMVWALVFRGGLLLRAIGIAVVTRNGQAVSRLRALWRGVVAWAWVVVAVWLAFPAFTPGFVARLLLTMHVGAGIRIDLAIGAAVIFLTGAMAAVVAPERSLQDRIVDTWLVPR